MNLTDDQIENIWQRGRVMLEADPAVWRQDACGAWIERNQFGRDNSEFGWKIENIAAGEPDALENLRPMHRRNHFDAAGKKLHCEVTADRTGVQSGQYATPPRNRSIRPQTGRPRHYHEKERQP